MSSFKPATPSVPPAAGTRWKFYHDHCLRKTLAGVDEVAIPPDSSTSEWVVTVKGKLEENGDVKLFTAVGRTKIAAREAAATKVLRAWGIIPEPDATMEEA